MFVAEEVAVEVIRAVGPVLAAIRVRDRELEDQGRRAATSIALNVAEGRAREGRDRLHCFRLARGSARELAMVLRVAEAWGYVDKTALASTSGLMARMLALLWGLTKPR